MVLHAVHFSRMKISDSWRILLAPLPSVYDQLEVFKARSYRTHALQSDLSSYSICMKTSTFHVCRECWIYFAGSGCWLDNPIHCNSNEFQLLGCQLQSYISVLSVIAIIGQTCLQLVNSQLNCEFKHKQGRTIPAINVGPPDVHINLQYTTRTEVLGKWLRTAWPTKHKYIYLYIRALLILQFPCMCCM